MRHARHAVSAATTTELNAADALYSLGLFLGTNKGYELNNSLTREQSAMLLVRMLGALETAEAGSYTHPFTDVAPWASKVVAYAYANEYVKGYSATKYGGADTVTDFQYLTIVLARPRLHRRRREPRLLLSHEPWSGEKDRSR